MGCCLSFPFFSFFFVFLKTNKTHFKLVFQSCFYSFSNIQSIQRFTNRNKVFDFNSQTAAASSSAVMPSSTCCCSCCPSSGHPSIRIGRDKVLKVMLMMITQACSR